MIELTQEQRNDYANRLQLTTDIIETVRNIQLEIVHDKWKYPHGTFFQKYLEWDLGDGMTAKAVISVSLPGAEDYFSMMSDITASDDWDDEEDEE